MSAEPAVELSALSDAPGAPLDESRLAVADDAAARELAARLPLNTRFQLSQEVTPLQRAFLDVHGYVVFAQPVGAEELEELIEAIDEAQDKLIADDVRQIRGVPVWVGDGPEGTPIVQRQGFLSMVSPRIRAFVTDPRFEPVRRLIGENARVGHEEKDGVVLNRYCNVPGSMRPGLGWHTDGLRDLFYGRLPKRMLNVGFHFDRIRPEDGGLRIIPGTHNQGFLSMLLRKPYFVAHKADAQEIAVETWPGDLTVHDGRTWHRVQASPYVGARSMRRSMYVPYLTHEFSPREESHTPAYQRLFDRYWQLKRRWMNRRKQG